MAKATKKLAGEVYKFAKEVFDSQISARQLNAKPCVHVYEGEVRYNREGETVLGRVLFDTSELMDIYSMKRNESVRFIHRCLERKLM